MAMDREMAGSRRQRGAVALEFLMLFPLVVAMLYAAAAYSVLFYSKYQIQDAVDKAVASAMRVDRSSVSGDDLESAVTSLSGGTLAALIAQLPDAVASSVDDTATSCGMITSSGVDLLQCSIRVQVSSDENPIVSQWNFGFLGAFPPLPDSMTVESVIAI
ncbi:MAG: TadE/TadG family type IV pilus assembly protein [Marinobacter sp.]|uniref:TadE/TadG family type IV pilus assembly protein n=1 Tax=Marinobacter sp. TaxID=50741 RepID=UPI00299D29E2|nr:TadE/TadG family type IV pilus assembly protein [Marinobacter sp.]MDX1755303.1 TadE/TadG family type IV pilus assembly protein [Marinobacter sp.]